MPQAKLADYTNTLVLERKLPHYRLVYAQQLTYYAKTPLLLSLVESPKSSFEHILNQDLDETTFYSIIFQVFMALLQLQIDQVSLEGCLTVDAIKLVEIQPTVFRYTVVGQDCQYRFDIPLVPWMVVVGGGNTSSRIVKPSPLDTALNRDFHSLLCDILARFKLPLPLYSFIYNLRHRVLGTPLKTLEQWVRLFHQEYLGNPQWKALKLVNPRKTLGPLITVNKVHWQFRLAN